MDDRVDLVLPDQPLEQWLVADVAVDQHRLRGNRPGEAGREIVENDDPLAGIDQVPHHMAADIAAAASDQYAHRNRGSRCAVKSITQS